MIVSGNVSENATDIIRFEEARARVIQHLSPLGESEVSLKEAHGHVLSQPIHAPFDLPRFANSAMDGFGVRLADVEAASATAPVALKVAATVQAGQTDACFHLESGSAVKIFTGAKIPSGVEAVIMKEFCRTEDGAEHEIVLIGKSARGKDNIREQGEEFAAGSRLLDAGTLITPPVTGLLATLGLARVPVYQKPCVAIVVTGDELAQPGEPLQDSQIYESNAHALSHVLSLMGLKTVTYHTGDSYAQTKSVIETALKTADVLLTVGGVSVGDYDLVKDVFSELAVEEVFWRVAMKPGKPLFFGIQKNTGKPVFGLPGNPVSALVTFHQLVRPGLLKIMGQENPLAETFTAILTREIKKKAGRLDFVRGHLRYESGRLLVTPAVGQDSHMLGGLATANCLICFPQDKERLFADDPVTVEKLFWSYC